ncbi:MAG: hypothetical protein HZB76_04260 [Chlamydiae bacterium]|nr:hypothetical protein [Chlamydiota bacterium]
MHKLELVSKLKNKVFLLKAFVLVLSLFLLAFPKGGIKLFSLPLTWGYSFLGLTAILFLIRKTYTFQIDRIKVLFSLLPFQLISLLSFIKNEIDSIPFAVSFFVSFFLLPYIFFLVLSEYLDKIDVSFFLKIVKNSLFFIALFGIFLFFYKIFMGSFLEIPLLTVNMQDLGTLETSKCIDRGTVFKLISTYNNGNLYGIALLMFLPLLNVIEQKFYKRFLIKLSLILTLSRTVWVAFLFIELIYALFVKKRLKVIFAIGFFFLLMLLVSLYFEFSASWFLDTTLGSRTAGLEDLKVNWFSDKSFSSVAEMVYVSILDNFGVLGLLSFLLAMTSPIFLFLLKNPKNISNIHKSILIGLIGYLFSSLADGAIMLIPIMAFYWFLSAFIFSPALKFKE